MAPLPVALVCVGVVGAEEMAGGFLAASEYGEAAALGSLCQAHRPGQPSSWASGCISRHVLPAGPEVDAVPIVSRGDIVSERGRLPEEVWGQAAGRRECVTGPATPLTVHTCSESPQPPQPHSSPHSG